MTLTENVLSKISINKVKGYAQCTCLLSYIIKFAVEHCGH